VLNCWDVPNHEAERFIVHSCTQNEQFYVEFVSKETANSCRAMTSQVSEFYFGSFLVVSAKIWNGVQVLQLSFTFASTRA